MKIHFLIFTALLTAGASAQVQQTTTSTETVETGPVVSTQTVEKSKASLGTLSGVDPSQKTLTLSTKESSSPLRYSYSDETKFFDGESNALTPEALESGSVAEITYVQAGTTLVVTKAVFTKPAIIVQPVTEVVPVVPVVTKTITKTIIVKPVVAPSMVEENTTTTTTTKP